MFSPYAYRLMIQEAPTGLKVPAGHWIPDKPEATNDHRLAVILDEMPAAIWLVFRVDLA